MRSHLPHTDHSSSKVALTSRQKHRCFRTGETTGLPCASSHRQHRVRVGLLGPLGMPLMFIGCFQSSCLLQAVLTAAVWTSEIVGSLVQSVMSVVMVSILVYLRPKPVSPSRRRSCTPHSWFCFWPATRRFLAATRVLLQLTAPVLQNSMRFDTSLRRRCRGPMLMTITLHCPAP